MSDMGETAQAAGVPSLPARPVVCVGVLIESADERVLLVQTTKWRGLWGVAGGKVDWGETLAEAARREIREETGLELVDLQQIQLQEAILCPEFGKPAHMLLVDFYGRCAESHEQSIIAPNEEIVQWAWCTWPEALSGKGAEREGIGEEERPLNSYTQKLLQAVWALKQEAQQQP